MLWPYHSHHSHEDHNLSFRERYKRPVSRPSHTPSRVELLLIIHSPFVGEIIQLSLHTRTLPNILLEYHRKRPIHTPRAEAGCHRRHSTNSLDALQHNDINSALSETACSQPPVNSERLFPTTASGDPEHSPHPSTLRNLLSLRLASFQLSRGWAWRLFVDPLHLQTLCCCDQFIQFRKGKGCL